MKFTETAISNLLKVKGFTLISYGGSTQKKSVLICEKGHLLDVRVHDVLRGKSKCAICSGNAKISIGKVERKLKEKGFTLISYVGNTFDKSVMLCNKGHLVLNSYNVIVNKNIGCYQCSKVRKISLERAENACKKRNLTLLSFTKCKDKAVFKCDKGHVWEAVFNAVINRGRGCPECSLGGFKKHKPGYLYLLLSENGKFMKVGITNNIKKRIYDLTTCTPFTFSLYRSYYAKGEKVAKIERLILDSFEKSSFSGFSGCTEWLVFNKEIAEFCEKSFQ